MSLKEKQYTGVSLGFLLMFIYMVSYITRINYGAVIIEMVSELGKSKSSLSLALTGSFFTYGIGQVISGWIGDKIQPKYMIFIGLSVSSIMNLLIVFFSNPFILAAIWCINGFAQAFMWPPIVRLMACLLNDKEYSKATLIVSWGSSFGTIFVYLVSPLMIMVSGYKAMFIFSALCGAITIPFWLKLSPVIKENPEFVRKIEETEKNQPVKISSVIFNPMMLTIMIAIVLQGSLRDGITTWMPAYIQDTYNLGNSISILTGVVLPVFAILCFAVARPIHTNLITNPMTCAGTIFSFGAVFALILFFSSGSNIILAVISMALICGSMHGVNLILIGILPGYFKNTGCVSLISGVLNSCTYIGSAVSTYGIAVLTENIGWKYTIGIWFIIASLGALLCFICAPVWKKRIRF